MTDPDETANIVGEITAAFREHQAEEAARHPVTYHEASTGNIADQMDRYRDLDQRDALAGAIAMGKACGTYVPNEHVNEAKFPPLTMAEHLELLALGERIARYYRHPSQVDKAVKTGATWDQIAAAAGATAEAARAAYREWAEGQHKYTGMSDADYAAALEAAGPPAAAGRGPLTAELNARHTAAAAVLGDYKAALASAPLTSPPGREWMLRLASVLEDLLTALSGPDDEDDEDQADEDRADEDDDTSTCSTCGALISMFIGRQGGWLHYRGDGTTASPVEIYDAGHDATFAMGPGGVS